MSDRFMCRFWHKRKKKYITGHGYYINYSNGQIYTLNGSLNVTDQIVREFCTGHRDINGQLVFEGDARVTYEPVDDAYGESRGYLKFILVVEWSDKFSGFVIREYTEDPNMDADFYSLSDLIDSEGNLDFLITHNIFENPELLEQGDE